MKNYILKLTNLFFLQYTEIIPKIIEFFISKKRAANLRQTQQLLEFLHTIFIFPRSCRVLIATFNLRICLFIYPIFVVRQHGCQTKI